MQCPNCEREIAITDGQFCPYCGSPLNNPNKRKKKNSTLNREPMFDWGTNVTAMMVGVGALVVVLVLLSFVM